MASVVGVSLGDLTAMTASMLGLGAILAASAEVFMLLKWVGALYLIYLGIKLWLSPVSETAVEGTRQPHDARRMMAHTYVVTALNPKGIVFFVAFVPQFIDPTAPWLPQIIILEATFVSLAALNVLGFAMLASRAGNAIKNPSVQRGVNRTGGSLLIGAGLFTALWQKSS